MNANARYVIVWVALILASGVSACNVPPASGPDTEVTIRLTIPGAKSSGRSPQAGVPTGVASLRIEVSGPGMGNVTDQFSVTPGESVTRTLNVPSGPDRIFVVTALNEAEAALYRGTSEPVELVPDEPVSVPILMQPVLVTIAVTPPNPSVQQGATQAFSAIGTFGDGSVEEITASVNWESGDPAVATISAGGTASAVSPGTAVITAMDPAEGISGSTVLTVLPLGDLISIEVTPANASIAVGATQIFTATGTYTDSSTVNLSATVVWTSSDPSVAGVDAGGLASGVGPGTTTVTATDSGSGIFGSTELTVTGSALVSITVSPANPTVPVGLTRAFTATGGYSDNSTADITTSVTWSSSSGTVATINGAGVATALETGTTNITAGLGSVSGSTTMKVDPAVAAGIAAGGGHTCAVLTDETVKCWGDNEYGELGSGTIASSATPIPVAGLAPTASLSAGGDNGDGVLSAHSCGLLTDGTVWCWGDNTDGQLGDGTNVLSFTPVGVCDPADSAPCSSFLSGVSQVTAGYDHSCTRQSNGEAFCWGRNQHGQLGTASPGSSYSIAKKVCEDSICNNPLSGVADLSAGDGHTCGALSDGTVWCWGYNFYGQLGTGSKGGAFSYPVQVCAAVGVATCPAFLSNTVSVAAGADHSCAVLSDGTARCWGLNGLGQLGTGNTADSPIASRVCAPNLVAPCNSFLTGVTALSAGFYSTCALRSDGTVWCWGYNFDGQVGNAGNGTANSPTQVCAGGETAPCSKFLTGVTAISAGNFHVCALLSNGGIRCWGDDEYGQLGDGSTTNSNTPVAVTGFP